MSDPAPVMTLRAGDSMEFQLRWHRRHNLRIKSNSKSDCPGEERMARKSTKTRALSFHSQKSDVDWSAIRSEQPYDHTAPVTSTDNLYGRDADLTKLMRMATSGNVGSGYLFGQKRVGKTSLANAFAERLELAGGQLEGKDWIVIYVGSGDYVMADAVGTFTQLGRFLFDQLRRRMHSRIPNIMEYPVPGFTKGLAPLSTFVDHILDTDNNDTLRIMVILDEFDDLPLELVRRTSLAAALFQPIRQISSKPGCGFLASWRRKHGPAYGPPRRSTQ